MHTIHAVSRARRAHVLLVLIAAATLWWGCSGPLSNAGDALSAGEVDRAERYTREALAESPDDPEAHLMLARIAVARGDVAAADAHSLDAVRLAPRNAGIRRARARILLDANRPGPACAELAALQRLDPGALPALAPDGDAAGLLETSARAAVDSGFDRGAVACLDTLEARDPQRAAGLLATHIDVKRRVVASSVAAGRYDDALADLDWLVARDTDANGADHLQRGKLLLELGRDEEAAAAFEAYVDGSPTSQGARLGEVGNHLDATGRRVEAAGYLERANATADAPPLLAIDLARVQLRLGNEDRAREALRTFLAPDNQPSPDDFVEAAAVATELGWVDIAIEVLDRGTTAHPTALQPAVGLATLYDLRGEKANVEATFARLAESAPQDAVSLAAVADWLYARRYDELSVFYYEKVAALPDAPADLQLKRARAQLAAVDYPAMERALQAHIARNDGSVEARAAAADIALEARDGALAVEILEPAFQQSPGDRRVAELLAEAYERVGRLPDEIRVYETWGRNAPDPAAARLIVGEVLTRLGEEERAEAWFKEAAADPATAADGHFALGAFHYVAGRGDEADAAFDAFIEASPDRNAAMLELIAWYRTKFGGNEDAIAVAERMATEPGGIEGLLIASELHLKMQDREAALDAHRRYVAARRDEIVAAARAATDAAARYDDDYAEILIARLIEDDPEVPGLHALAGDIAMVHASRVVGEDLELADSLRAQAEASYQRYLDLAGPGDPDLERVIIQSADRRQYALAARAFDVGGSSLGSPRMQLVRADVLTRLGRFGEAGEVYQKYVDGGSGDEATKRALDAAGRLVDAGRAQDAEPFFRRALEADTRERAIAAYQGLATLLIASGRADELGALSRQALDRTALPWEMREVVARSHARAGDYDVALGHYRAMLQMRPNALSVAADIAHLGFISDDPSTATAALEAFVEQSPTPATAWRTIGDLYAERGEVELAIAAWEQALAASQREPDRELLLRLGALQARAGHGEDALATFERVLDGGDATTDGYVEAVLSLAATGQLEAADAMATRAIDRVQRPGPFVLFKIRRAVATGQRASALLWADEYRRRGAPLSALVDELIALGAWDSARPLVDLELRRGEWAEATRHSVALAPRTVLYAGLDRFLLDARRIAAGVLDPGPLLRTMAQRQADAGHVDEALILAGERLWSPDHTLDDALLRARLQLTRGFDADALATLVEAASVGEDRERQVAWQRGLDVLLDAGRLTLATRFLEQAVASGQLTMLPELVAVHIEAGDPDAALDMLRGGSMAYVFDERAPADAVAAMTTALVRLARLGFGGEAARLLATLDAVQGPSVAIATARVEALALERDDRVDAAVEALRVAHPDDAATSAATHALVGTGSASGATIALLDDMVASHDAVIARRALRDAVLAVPPTRADAAERVDALVSSYIDGRHDLSRAHLDVASTMLGLGEFDRAAAHYEVASELLPSEATVFEGLAEAHFLRGDSAAAIEAMERAANRRRDRLETLERLALHFASGPDAGVARAALRRVLESSPANARLRLELARQAWLAGDASDGDAQAEALYEASDQPTVVAGEVIGVLLEANQVDRAVQWSERIVDASDASALGLWHAGVALVRAERSDDAIPVFERAVARSLGPLELQVAAAEVFRRHGRLDQAERFLEKAIEAWPGSPAPHLYRGLFRLEQGDVEGARLEFDHVRESGWQPERSLELMGDALLGAGQQEAAEAYLGHLLALQTVDAEVRVDTVLDVFAAHEQAEQGLHFVEREAPGLLVQIERRPELAHAFGVALLRAGRGEDAREIATRLTQLEPRDAIGWDLLARAHLALESLDEAETAGVRATLLADDGSRGRYMATRGRIAAARGDLARAERDWLAALRLDAGAHPAWAATVLRSLAWAAEQRGDAQAYLRRAARAEAQTLQPGALR